MTKSFEKIPPKRSKYIYIFSFSVLTKYIGYSFCKFWNSENIFSSSKFPLYWYFLRKNDEIIITLKAHLRKMCIENSPCCNQRCYWFRFFVLETMQMRDNFLSLNLCLKRHDRTTTTRASSFFYIFLEVIESVSFCCEKAKYIRITVEDKTFSYCTSSRHCL